MKNLLFFLLAISSDCFSQNKEKTETTNITKVTFITPGASYEKKAGKFQSIFFEAFASISGYMAFSTNQEPGTRTGLYIAPALALQYRYYYNSARRKAKGKRTEMNSSNYVCSKFQTVFSNGSISPAYLTENRRRAINMFGIAWGIQRNYKRRFSLDINLGGGYLFTKVTATTTGQLINKNVGKFTSVGEIRLGFWLNKNK